MKNYIQKIKQEMTRERHQPFIDGLRAVPVTSICMPFSAALSKWGLWGSLDRNNPLMKSMAEDARYFQEGKTIDKVQYASGFVIGSIIASPIGAIAGMTTVPLGCVKMAGDFVREFYVANANRRYAGTRTDKKD